MAVNKSLGGIGRLYCNDSWLGEVYYNITQEQPQELVGGSIVFVGKDIDLPNTDTPYRLFLEDGRYLILTLSRNPLSRFSPYSCTSCDGILHSTRSYSLS